MRLLSGDIAGQGSLGGKMVVREVSTGMGNRWRTAKKVSFPWCSVRWGLRAWREGSDGVPGSSK